MSIACGWAIRRLEDVAVVMSLVKNRPSRSADLSAISTAGSSSTVPPPGSERGWKSIQVAAADCSPGKAPSYRWTLFVRIALIDRPIDSV
jgi:hypothetical protein